MKRIPLSYLGISSGQPPRLVIENRAPTEKDYHYPLATVWILKNGEDIWFLTNKEQQIATWQQAAGGSGGIQNFITDSGTVTETNQRIDMLGGTNINTFADGDAITIDTLSSVEFNSVNLPLAEGVAYTNASGVIGVRSGTNGQLIVAGTTPNYTTVTSSDGSISFVTGSNSLQIKSNGSGATSFATDSGSVTAMAGEINFFGGSNITTTGDTVNTITVDLDDTVTVATVTLGGDLNLSGDVTSSTYNLSNLSEGVVEVSTGGTLNVQSPGAGETPIGPSNTGVVWNTFTDSATVTVTNGDNEITLSAVGGGGGASQAFLAVSTDTPTLNKATEYFLGGNVGFAMTAVQTLGGGYDAGDGISSPATFTAGSTGLYQLSMSLIIEIPYALAPTQGNIDITWKITTSNRTYTGRETMTGINGAATSGSNPGRYGNQFEVLADMDAADTATFSFTYNGASVTSSAATCTLYHYTIDPSGPSAASTIIWGFKAA